jgi:hypothetical protein
MDNKKQLTEEERKELELLDNPAEQRMGNIAGGLPAMLFGMGDPLTNKKKRKEKVVELRTKMRMFELDLDSNKDWQKYYEIREEEEKRFDERFKDIR